MGNKKLDPIIFMLGAGIVFFTVVILACVRFVPTDGQTFQLFGGALTAFIGALLGLINGEKKKSGPTETATVSVETPSTLAPSGMRDAQ